MGRSIASEKNYYLDLWAKCVIKEDKKAAADKKATRIVANKPRYEIVSKTTGVPWFVIGSLHNMESNCDFTTHLHNGDPLTARTIQTPKGRPVDGNPPFKWEVSAIDALGYDHLTNVGDWSLEATLFRMEAYNGFGNRAHNINSPYLWSYSNQYTKGKYVKDKVWSDTAVSAQCGAAVLLKRLIALGAIAEFAPDLGAKTADVFRPLQLGDNNSSVKQMQTWLKNHGFFEGKTIDGDFGPVTKAALTQFQHCAYHQYYTAIKMSGICDQWTWDGLKDAIPGSIKNIDYGVDEPLTHSKPELPKPTPPAYPQSTTSEAYKDICHVKDVKSDVCMSNNQGIKFYSEGTLRIVDNKLLFSQIVNNSTKADYGSAQCAITIAGILEAEFNAAGLMDFGKIFSKENRSADKFALTHQIEIALRRMGWVYYLSKDFVAFKGAIGLMAGRYNFGGSKDHSGHVYTIFEDKYPEHDIICDNGGYAHVYAYKTEGFWLPPGMSPKKRLGTPAEPKVEPKPAEPTLSNAVKYIEFYKANYDKVRAEVNSWFTGVYSPTPVSNGCVAHVTS